MRRPLAAIALAAATWAGATASAHAADRAPASTAPASAAPGPVVCDDLIDQPLQAELAEAGYRPADMVQTSDEPTMHDESVEWSAWAYIFEQDGLTCWWLRDVDPDAAAVGYAVVSDQEALEADLVESGYTLADTEFGPVYTLAPESEVGAPVVTFSANEVLLGEGVVMAARGLHHSALAQIRTRILPLLDIPEPVVEEPVVEEPIADADTSDADTSDSALEPATDTGVPAAASASLDDSAAAPSTLSGLRTPGQVNLDPVILGCTLAMTLVFAAILAFPGKLMETAISENYDRVSRVWAPLTAAGRRAGASLARAPLTRAARSRASRMPRAAPLAIGVLAAAIIAGFVDPSFGFNAGSVRMVASNLVSFGVEAIVGAALVAGVARRWAIAPTARIGLVAGSLGILLVTVLASRLTGFVPGVVFGLIVAASVPSALAKRDGLRLAVVEVVYVAGAGMLAWAFYGVLAEPLAASGGILDRFAVEALAAIAVLGLSALPILLLPFRGMAGAAIFAVSRGMWMVAYVLGTSLFMLVLLPFPGSWEQTSSPFWVWVTLFAVYAVVSVIVWFVLTKTRRRPGGESQPNAVDHARVR
ncbi:hypothetical protein M4I32_13675 [Microbacterium sp. LRZ72]|uniref:hypothetical protein n=1 Tax=Microbacterium sp. LRZ72 TaxID=2942481 RepID=UPI0029AE8B15|nr:hypothetical protein [Microbacterium sp. LRZ72]MDX2377846.1 hypothetical protein [Microbacterium sp. LRZ72]